MTREPLITRAKRRIGLLPKEQPQRPSDLTYALETRVQAIEAAMKTAYEERMQMAGQVAEGNRRIREQDFHIGRLQNDLKVADEKNGSLLQQVGSLNGRLDVSERSHKEQGARIGQLEHEVKNLTKEAALVPPLREQLAKLQLLLNLYHQWGQQVVTILNASNITAPAPPLLDLTAIEQQTWKLSQVEGSAE